MQSARDALAPDLHSAHYGNMAFPVVANVTANPVMEPAEIAALLARQITASVRWVESIETLAALGVTTFVEFGSGTVLSGLVKRILPDADVRSIHTPHDIQNFVEAS